MGSSYTWPTPNPARTMFKRPVLSFAMADACLRAPLEIRSVGFRGKRAICRKLQLRGSAFQTDFPLPEVRITES